MRAGAGMREEDADFLSDLRTQGMFDSQSVLVHHVVVDVEGIMKQAFGEAVAPEGLSGPRLSKLGERDFAVLDTDQSFLCHALEGGPVGHEFRHLLGADDALPGVFLGVPDGFEKVVNPFSLDRGQKRRRGQAAMMQFDVTLRSAAYFRVMGHHDDGVTLAVQLRE